MLYDSQRGGVQVARAGEAARVKPQSPIPVSQDQIFSRKLPDTQQTVFKRKREQPNAPFSL